MDSAFLETRIERFDGPDADALALMGSHAREAANPYSDVDLTRFSSAQGLHRKRSFQGLIADHRPTAWGYAFDYDLLRRNRVQAEPSTAYTIVGEDVRPCDDGQGCVMVLLTADQPLLLRVDTLLAKKLGVSRAQLGALFASGGAAMDPASGCALRDRLKREARILIDRAALRARL